MTDARRILLTLVTGSFLTASALVTATLATPAVANADESDVAPADVQAAEEEKPPCPDGSVRSGVSGECVDQMTSLAEQLNRLPPPPGFGSPQEAVATLAGGAPPLNGIPGLPLATVNMPDLVLPSLGIGLVPDIPVILQPQFPINFPAPSLPAPSLPAPSLPDLTQLPPPQLPNLTQLPPPQLPDLTKLPPPQLPSLG